MAMKLFKIIFAVVATTLLFSWTNVSAAPLNTNVAQGMEISPTLVELNAAPGNTYNITLKVRNVTQSNLIYDSSVADFAATDETGSPHVTEDAGMPATASVRTWVGMVPQFDLIPKQVQTINAQITIPDNAEPGGHYGVLRFSGQAPELSGNAVGIQASAGVLLLIRVDGEITESASLAEFFTTKNGRQSGFFEQSPITFATRIKNDGNIHIKPTGSIQVLDMFGGLISTLPVNGDKSNVLPSSIRRFESTLDGKFLIGRYTANLTLGYGTTGQAITNTINFWVIPYKLIAAVIFVAITVIFILVRLIRVYNRHIIEKSKNEKPIKNKKASKTKGKGKK